MIYRTDNGTNTLLLEILSDLTKSPSISFSTGTTVTPTSEDFTYEVPSSIWVGDSSFTFTVSDSTGSETFTVYQAASTDINISLQETGERTYTLAVASSSTDISDNTVDTIDTIAAEYPTLTAGERVRTFFGKIKKFLADLKDLKYDKTGGHISGGMYPDAGTYFEDSTALPQQADGNTYNVIVFDAFSAGGQAKYIYATYAATGSRIVSRNANGDICARYFNTSCAAENPASYTSSAAFIDSNGYLRKSSKANFTAWLGFNWSGQTATPTYVWGGNANNTWYVYPKSIIAGIEYLGSTSSSTAKNFTIRSTCTEIVIAGSFTGDGINKIFSSPIPKNLLSTTAKEVWLGGGGGGTNASQTRCLCNVTLVNSTTVQVKGTAASNGTTNMLSGTTFYVYQR